MNRSALILAGLAGIWYGAVNAYKSLIVGVRDYAFRGLDLLNNTVSLDLNILVKNPLLFGVTVKSVQGDVYIDGQKVGYVNTRLDYYLTGTHTHILPVIVNLHLQSLAQTALWLIQNGNMNQLEIAFDGQINVTNQNIAIPIQKELTWEQMTA